MASKPKPPVENKNPESIPIYCAYDELLPIEQLKPNPKNNNIHPDEQIKLLAKLIENHGWRLPITVSNLSGCIVRGHGKLMAARLLGAEVIPVDFQDYKDYAQELADLMADNKIPELSLFNDDLTKELLSEIKELDADFDMELTGFSDEELNVIFDLDDPTGPIEGEDDIPDPPAEPKSKIGDLYQLGRHRLLCGDSTKREDVERLMGGEKADMVFTDPPYGVSYADKNAFLNAISPANRIQEEIKNDHQSEKDICQFWKKYFEIVRDNLAEVNSYYITGPQIQGMMMMMMQEAGLPYRHVIIWVKNNHVLGRCDYHYRHEPLFFGWTTKHKFYGNGQFKTSVWEIDKPLKNDLHPTMKPIALMENALLNSSEKGQICFDGFGGSGSTLIACEKTNRRCFMMEIDAVYIDVIIQRWETFTGQKAVKL